MGMRVKQERVKIMAIVLLICDGQNNGYFFALVKRPRSNGLKRQQKTADKQSAQITFKSKRTVKL